ncbi:hypothetical protein AURDEDRAFT_183182 [Auricularia subglabra TFB-10046 SS5]|nr:hypothetical protein AURDEDRAFT_183182 [Auricularia subglabra TFB-10046 SS5]
MASATVEQPRYVWLAAQSNVAVKNIARKLVDINFMDFRLLVSNEFFFDWHEHLYLRVQKHMIPSKEFPKGKDAAAELLDGVRVILCTLSMLSHVKLAPFTAVVPVETLVIDEASQIELGDFVPVLCNYAETIRKLVFVGDDKQLAPFGQDDIPNLKSVFEIDQLRRKAVFLNTQYRMPMAIGQFISNEIYKGQLRSQHPDASRDACRFVDVPLGLEEQRGHSWANKEECKTAVDVARILHAEEKDFRIITPYDGQRSEVEQALKRAELPWEERVFNVDSFQGNEAPYIILTVVRTERVGFLKNERRTNVMLSRCQQGLVIVCNRRFLSGYPARTTLVGRMAAEWGDDAWVGARRVANGSLEPGEDPEVDEPPPPPAEDGPSLNDWGGSPSLNDWGGGPDVDWSTGEATVENDWSLPAEDWSIPPPDAAPPPGLGRGRGTGKGADRAGGRKNKNRGRSPPPSSQSSGAPANDGWDLAPGPSTTASGWDDSGWDIPPAAAAAAAAKAKAKDESTWDAPAGPSTAGWDDSAAGRHRPAQAISTVAVAVVAEEEGGEAVAVEVYTATEGLEEVVETEPWNG